MRPVNDGSRPSQLELGRRYAGERPGPVDATFAAAMQQTVVEPFDYTALRARSERLVDLPPAVASPPRWRSWFVVPTLLAAAAALFLVVSPPPDDRTKGSVDLDFYVLRDDQPLLGDPTAPHAAGDRLQFSYLAGGYDRVVLLSADGVGTTTVYFPSEGEDPVPVYAAGRHVLDQSVILDDAPGPEVFVACFGEWSVSEARDRVEAAWQAGGSRGVHALADADPSIATITVEKE